MPEIIIKYKNKRTLEVLKVLSKYFDFSIVTSTIRENKKVLKTSKLNGLTIVQGNSSVDTTELSEIFSGRNIDAKKLRKKAWQRAK